MMKINMWLYEGSDHDVINVFEKKAYGDDCYR